jgi:hypothetical protein
LVVLAIIDPEIGWEEILVAAFVGLLELLL